MMSNIILNFSPSGTYQLRINSALAPLIQHSEEEFSRVCREVEVFALPVYISLVRVIVDHSRGDFVSCLSHLRKITSDLRPLMAAYYDRVHDATGSARGAPVDRHHLRDRSLGHAVRGSRGAAGHEAGIRGERGRAVRQAIRRHLQGAAGRLYRQSGIPQPQRAVDG